MPWKQALAVAALPLMLGGCNAALWGNLLVLAVTSGVFFGTLTLGQADPPTPRSPDRSPSSSRSQS